MLLLLPNATDFIVVSFSFGFFLSLTLAVCMKFLIYFRCAYVCKTSGHCYGEFSVVWMCAPNKMYGCHGEFRLFCVGYSVVVFLFFCCWHQHINAHFLNVLCKFSISLGRCFSLLNHFRINKICISFPLKTILRCSAGLSIRLELHSCDDCGQFHFKNYIR